MLDNLVFNNNGSYEGLGTFGLQQYGLDMTLIIADRLNVYSDPQNCFNVLKI